MSQLVKKEDQIRSIQAMVDQMKGQFGRVLARQIGAERFTRICQTELRTVRGLAECDPDSILGAFLKCATLNLEPGVNGQCWIIPFKGKAQFMPGYQGLLDLAWRSEQISSVSAEVVYKGDEFEYELGDSPFIRHRPAGNRNAADLIYAYAVLHTTTRGKIRAVLNEGDIALVRKASSAGNHGPWQTHTASMWKKSALKQACKLGPSSSELRSAIALDDLREVGKDQHLAAYPVDAAFTEDAPSSATGPVALPEKTEEPPPNGKCPSCDVSLVLVARGGRHKPGCEEEQSTHKQGARVGG